MAEMLVQDASLTAIADAIRAKAETIDELVFPNGFVEAISALTSFPEGVNAVASGTYTPASVITTPVIVEHGMKVCPNFMFIIPESVRIEKDAYGGGQIKWQVTFDQNHMYSDGGSTGGIWVFDQTMTTSGRSSSPSKVKENGGYTDKYCYFYSSPSVFFKAGVTYRWIAANITRT